MTSIPPETLRCLEAMRMMTKDPALKLAEAHLAAQWAENQRLRADLKKWRRVALILSIAGTVTWIAGLLS